MTTERGAAAEPAAVVAAIARVLGRANDPVPLHEPLLGERERALVDECVASGWVSSVGKFVDLFERQLAEATGARHAVAVASGTAALHVAYMLAGAGPGDEVLVPALTFVATANAIAHCGAIPHFVDVDPATLAVDPAGLRAHLDEIARREGGALVNRSTGRRIAALVLVHPFGYPAPAPELLEVAAAYGLPLVEDAAEAFGARLDGRAPGTFGRLGTLSFNGNKIVTTGGGGAILTDDPELAKAAKHITTTAKLPHRWRFDHDRVAFNYRLPNLNAALGVAQLERLEGFVAAKRRLAELYREAFAGVSGVRSVAERDGTESNGWLATVVLEQGSPERLDAVLAACHAANYLVRPAWTALHTLPMFRDCPRMAMTQTERLTAAIVNLPSSPALALRLAA